MLAKKKRGLCANSQELGAGCGLAGLVAAAVGCDVALTDGSDIVLSLLRRAREACCAAEQSVVVEKLLWGDRESLASFVELWGDCDLLLGADVVAWSHTHKDAAPHAKQKPFISPLSNLSRISLESLSRISLSRISLETLSNLSRISLESLSNLSRISLTRISLSHIRSRSRGGGERTLFSCARRHDRGSLFVAQAQLRRLPASNDRFAICNSVDF